MAESYILRTIFILVCISHIHGQYFDLFQALQPYVQPQPSQPLNFFNEFTTKRPRPKQKVTENGRAPEDNIRRSVASEQADKRRKLSNPYESNFFSTTQKAIRKTTKVSVISAPKSQNRQESKPSKVINDSRNRETPIYFENDPKPSKINFGEPNRGRPSVAISPTTKKSQYQQSATANYDLGNVWYDDGRNSVNFFTTKPPFYETTKSYYTQKNRGNKNNYPTTHNPLLHRPGVKPPVVSGPPITNRPVTQRPVWSKPEVTTHFDDAVSPEVISGPDEDYMSAVEKKRYIDISERMCDKYKSLNQKQLAAIPLVPSPQPVRVNISSCPPTNVPLVIGGKVVTIKEFPHMALLGWKKTKNRGYSWKCGGSLLSEQYVLTAGHCAYQDRDDSVIAGPPRVVQLGSSYLNDPQATLLRVAAVIRHPKYKQPKAYYDLAIVKLASTVSFSDSIKPACMGTPPTVNQPVIATGWGRTEFGGSQSHELRSVSVPIWDMGECYDALGVSMKIPYGPSEDSQICAGERQGGKDTCQGDSGGPAQVQEGCTWRVVAVTSIGRSCGAAETPAIYAIVQRAFISAVIFKESATQNNNDNYGTNNNNWNNKNQQTTNRNPPSNQWNRNPTNAASNNNDNYGTNNNNWNNKNQQTSNGNPPSNQWKDPTNSAQNNNNYGTNNNNWNSNNNNQQTGANQQNNFNVNTGVTSDYNTQGNGNIWNNQRGNNNRNGQRDTNNNYSNQNNQPNRNVYDNNFNNYNQPTTEWYNNNKSRRENNNRETGNNNYYNDYASNNNNNNRDTYNIPNIPYDSNPGGESYYNDRNVWWT